MDEQQGIGVFITGILPLIILSLPMAAGIWWISPKIPANRWLWTILAFVPIVNIVAFYVFFFLVIGAVLDKLNALQTTRPFD